MLIGLRPIWVVSVTPRWETARRSRRVFEPSLSPDVLARHRCVMPAAATIPANELDARAAQVSAAVEALAGAIGKIGTADCGKAFVDAVKDWKGTLDRRAPTLH